MADSLLDIPCVTLTGEHKHLGDFAGKALLVVNTASQCGFTPQYQGLEQLWQAYREQGLVVVGFPCNQFGKQEPGDAREIAKFCETRFGVSFPLMRKVEVNGSGAHPLFVELKKRAPGLLGTQKIKWNFTKFLIDPLSGEVDRFAPTTKPEALQGKIERLLSR
ncbi:bsaA-like glutathione peroxidase [Pseudomonas reidholzensis]|uniref:Glutathione peroxidase n=1 Tax=Pseudomonas reidholzensis TaxID=1785162 RepID=A0A383RZZ7_9PSED|nr:glutathione peroxidase [Pseudomonas reidholzensis]SYX92056.1 bsaA-like glutathione peroxidase [Pseudomonas reidholzensis]